MGMWVLIIMMWWGTGVGVITQEFSTYDRCLDAEKFINDSTANSYGKTVTTCIKK